MFKRILFKSVAGATAAGSVVAMSLVATPATITSAPEIRNVACEIKYPQSVSTTTQLSLKRTAAQYGTQNAATVKVTRDEAGGRTPIGRAVIRIVGVRTYTVPLVDGEATVRFPRTLTARRTYTVRANYVPPSCSVFAPSASGPSYYTVIRAGVRLRVNAPNINQTVRPRVNITASSLTGMTPPGQVRVRIYRRAVLVGAKWVSLNDGFARAFFPRKRPGYYQAEVFYPARQNFSTANGEDDFRIFRAG